MKWLRAVFVAAIVGLAIWSAHLNYQMYRSITNTPTEAKQAETPPIANEPHLTADDIAEIDAAEKEYLKEPLLQGYMVETSDEKEAPKEEKEKEKEAGESATPKDDGAPPAVKKPPKKDVEYTVADDAKITYDGKEIKLSAMPEKAYIRFWVDEENPTLIIEIEGRSTPFPDDEEEKPTTGKEKK